MPIVYVNLVGGQDELVFDGASFVVNAAGRVIQRAPAFVEALILSISHGRRRAVATDAGTLDAAAAERGGQHL